MTCFQEGETYNDGDDIDSFTGRGKTTTLNNVLGKRKMRLTWHRKGVAGVLCDWLSGPKPRTMEHRNWRRRPTRDISNA